MDRKVEICAPAGNLPALIEAVDNGADAVYLGFSGDTNLRNFPALNFTDEEVKEGIEYAHKKGRKVYVTVNSYPQERELPLACETVEKAYTLGADAVIASDMGVLSFIKERFPEKRVHLSVQASASNPEAIKFYQKHFGIKRVVLPRVLTIDEIQILRTMVDVEIEVFVLGLLCINSEGQCFLSSYITGESINTYGACSHPKFIDFVQNEDEGTVDVFSSGILLNRYMPHEEMAYPTPCKGKYINRETGETGYAIQDPESLNALELLPELISAGVDAIKIEGRQRSKAYVAKVVRLFRSILDDLDRGRFDPEKGREIQGLFEGLAPSTGCYKGK